MKAQSHVARRACAYKASIRESVNYLQDEIDREIEQLESLARQLNKDLK